MSSSEPELRWTWQAGRQGNIVQSQVGFQLVKITDSDGGQIYNMMTVSKVFTKLKQ